jgi:hypothetical protein
MNYYAGTVPDGKSGGLSNKNNRARGREGWSAGL